MHTHISNLLDEIRHTLRYREGVKKLAEKLKDEPPKTFEQLIEILIDNSENESLGILYLVIALNQSQINYNLLANGVQYVDDIRNAFSPFSNASAKAVPVLLKLAETESLSWERQTQAAFTASYLTRKFELEPKPVEKILRKLRLEIDSPENLNILFHANQLLSEKDK